MLAVIYILRIKHYWKDTKVSGSQGIQVKEATSWCRQVQLPMIGKGCCLMTWQESHFFRLQDECNFLSAGRKRKQRSEACTERSVWAPRCRADDFFSTEASVERTCNCLKLVWCSWDSHSGAGHVCYKQEDFVEHVNSSWHLNTISCIILRGILSLKEANNLKRWLI